MPAIATRFRGRSPLTDLKKLTIGCYPFVNWRCYAQTKSLCYNFNQKWYYSKAHNSVYLWWSVRWGERPYRGRVPPRGYEWKCQRIFGLYYIGGLSRIGSRGWKPLPQIQKRRTLESLRDKEVYLQRENKLNINMRLHVFHTFLLNYALFLQNYAFFRKKVHFFVILIWQKALNSVELMA